MRPDACRFNRQYPHGGQSAGGSSRQSTGSNRAWKKPLPAGDTISYSPADPHSWGDPDDEAPAVALFFGMAAEY